MAAKTSSSLSTGGQRSFTFQSSGRSGKISPLEQEPASLATATSATGASTSFRSSYPPLSTTPSSSAPLLPSTAAAASSTTTAPTSWESLRKQARKLENEVDVKLVAFARAGASTRGHSFGLDDVAVGAGAGSPRRTSVVGTDAGEAEVEELLRRLTNVVDKMAAYIDGMAGAQVNSSMLHMLQRHRDILHDYTREFKKTKTNIQSSREHAELLRSVREDISSYRSGAAGSQDILLTERGRIDNSHMMADQVLEQAYETKDSLWKQRGMLAGANRRITLAASQIPGINSIIGKIGRRKRRDSVILAGVISFCLFLLLMYLT